MRRFDPLRLFLLTLVAGGFVPGRAGASEAPVVAVLSSNSRPYRQAFEGVQQEFGGSVPSYVLTDGTPKIPSDTRVIVAIGGKAALHHYPAGTLLIYCLAPGTLLKAEQHPGRLLKIHTNPSVPLTVAKFKELQPTLRRLAVLWTGDSIQDYLRQKSDILSRMGVEMVSERIRTPDDLPDRLRALNGKVDALWLPPDAAMVTPQNFTTIKEFSVANTIPFYAPSEGLVEQGATAAVSSSFEDIGALAARMAREEMEGSLDVDSVFPEKIHLSINLTIAKTCNLTIPADVLKQADKVIP